MAQLRLQDAVLFAQVQDDLVLLPLEPAEEGRDQELRNHGVESTPTAGRGFRTQRADEEKVNDRQIDHDGSLHYRQSEHVRRPPIQSWDNTRFLT
jgi:hypothetical protein